MTASDRGITELEVLSTLAATILREGPPAKYEKLLLPANSGAPASMRLAGVTPEQLLDVPIRDHDDARAMLAGLWLWFDGLEEAHRLAQDIPSPTGSFWHAIIHRREGDFSNARYWYARCGGHRVNHLLGAVTASAVGNPDDSSLLRHLGAGAWDGAALVDLVEAVHDHLDDPRYSAAIRLQQVEWQALFHHCALAASGSPLD